MGREIEKKKRKTRSCDSCGGSTEIIAAAYSLCLASLFGGYSPGSSTSNTTFYDKPRREAGASGQDAAAAAGCSDSRTPPPSVRTRTPHADTRFLAPCSCRVGPPLQLVLAGECSRPSGSAPWPNVKLPPRWLVARGR